MRVNEIMSRNVATIAPNDEAALARNILAGRGIRHLVVVDGRKVMGIVSDRDLGKSLEGLLVREVMTPSVITISPNATEREVANKLRGHVIGCLPVVDRGKLVGIITTTDLLEQVGRGAKRLPTPVTRWKPVRRMGGAPKAPPPTR